MYNEEMLESIKKVEANRAANAALEPRRMTADEKEALLSEYHPDYKKGEFAELKIGPNKGEKVPKELAELLQANSRLKDYKPNLENPVYDVDVLITEEEEQELPPQLKQITQAQKLWLLPSCASEMLIL